MRSGITAGRRRAVDSLVARIIVDGEFNDLAQRDIGQALALCDLEQGDSDLLVGLDVDRVAMFAGLVVKVHHTYLWGVLPVTLQLLKKADLELRLFALYAPVYRKLTRDRAVAMEDKTWHFITFCREQLVRQGHPRARLLIDALNFEAFSASDRARELAMRARLDSPVDGPSRGIPRRVVDFEICRYSHPISAAMQCWGAGDFDYVPDPAETFLLVSSGASDGVLQLTEVDRVTALLLDRVDGRSSIESLAMALMGSRNAPPAVVSHVKSILLQAEISGLVRVDP